MLTTAKAPQRRKQSAAPDLYRCKSFRVWEKQYAIQLMLEWDRHHVLGHPDLPSISVEQLTKIMRKAGWREFILYDASEGDL